MDELMLPAVQIECRWCQWPLHLRDGAWLDDFDSRGCPAGGPGLHWPVLPVPAGLLPPTLIIGPGPGPAAAGEALDDNAWGPEAG